MSDLVSRLLAAIEEAERIAQDTADVAGPDWHSEPCDSDQCEGHIRSERKGDLIACQPYEGGGMAAIPIGPHIARNDPDAVLRRCAADRELVEKYREIVAESDRVIERGYAEPDEMVSERLAFEWVIKNRAASYGISVEEETTA